MRAKRTRLTTLAAASLLAALACSTDGEAPADPAAPAAPPADEVELTRCTDPRPEICTQHYDPVCGRRDTGVRCVTEPCDGAFELRTYANACAACSDAKVDGHRPGACPEPD